MGAGPIERKRCSTPPSYPGLNVPARPASGWSDLNTPAPASMDTSRAPPGRNEPDCASRIRVVPDGID
jgi:hypothetical protein